MRTLAKKKCHVNGLRPKLRQVRRKGVENSVTGHSIMEEMLRELFETAYTLSYRGTCSKDGRLVSDVN